MFIENKKTQKNVNKLERYKTERKDLSFELQNTKKNVQQENNVQEKQKVNVQGR